jgi:hypothetical protein
VAEYLPISQLMQLLEASSARFPAPQKLHRKYPTPGATKPLIESHFKHTKARPISE